MADPIQLRSDDDRLRAMDRLRARDLEGAGRGGPPDNDNMDARVTKLEGFAKEAGERLARVETKLDHIEKEVGGLKWWLLGSVVTILLTVLATSIGIQQMTVATFQGAAQVAKDAAPAATTLPPIIINVPAALAPVAPTQAPSK